MSQRFHTVEGLSIGAAIWLVTGHLLYQGSSARIDQETKALLLRTNGIVNSEVSRKRLAVAIIDQRGGFATVLFALARATEAVANVPVE